MEIKPIYQLESWTCDICCNDNGLSTATYIDNNTVCGICIHHIFEAATKSEANFPPRWGSQVLDIWDFRHSLSTLFIAQYQKKADEWSCPARMRVYCRQSDPPKRPEECDTFMGRSNETRICRQCNKCRWYTCLRCSECFSPSHTGAREVTIRHRCDPSVEMELRRQAFVGLKRGSDYQDCPNPVCQRRIQLIDGCNCIMCTTCGTQFCYICGRRALEGSSHWNYGSKCPKWNQPVSKPRPYEPEYEDTGDDEDRALEARLEMLRAWDRRGSQAPPYGFPRETLSPPTKSPYTGAALSLGEDRHDRLVLPIGGQEEPASQRRPWQRRISAAEEILANEQGMLNHM